MTNKELENKIYDEIQQIEISPDIKSNLEKYVHKNQIKKTRMGRLQRVLVICAILLLSLFPVFIPSHNLDILYDDNSEMTVMPLDKAQELANQYNIKLPECMGDLPLHNSFGVYEDEQICAVRLDYLLREKKITVYISLTTQYALHNMFAGLPERFVYQDVHILGSEDNYLFYFENRTRFYFYVKKVPANEIESMIYQFIQ